MQALETTQKSARVTTPKDEESYSSFLKRMEAKLRSNLEAGQSQLFTTDAVSLFEAYLSGFPTAEERQYHNCNCCRHFINRFGGLVTINAKGVASPAFWEEDDAPDEYKASIKAMKKIVAKAKVNGVFVSEEKVFGHFKQGGWTHLALVNPNPYRNALKTAYQASAEKSEDFKTVVRALQEFSMPTLSTALTLLNTDSLYRSEKVIGPAKWLHKLQEDTFQAKGKQVQQLIWLAVATAPAGFCHPRSSMVGTLLEDIASGMSFEQVSKRFAEKMNPTKYQRPVAAPATGNLKQAEEIFAKLGAERSLLRRFARLDEIPTLWEPSPQKAPEQGSSLFGHLGTKQAPKPVSTPMLIPPQKMTWEKFAREILPHAEQISISAPSHGSYCSLVTAVYMDAPPIIQWDTPENRNPVSWYVYSGGSSASDFNIPAGKATLSAITQKPCEWTGGSPNHGKGIVFLIEGAKDLKKPSLCLFPEILKSDFRAVRSVIEAHNKSTTISGIEEASASGLMVNKGLDWNVTLWVTSGGQEFKYIIDRFD